MNWKNPLPWQIATWVILAVLAYFILIRQENSRWTMGLLLVGFVISIVARRLRKEKMEAEQEGQE